jgi:hypothetical protein
MEQRRDFIHTEPDVLLTQIELAGYLEPIEKVTDEGRTSTIERWMLINHEARFDLVKLFVETLEQGAEFESRNITSVRRCLQSVYAHENGRPDRSRQRLALYNEYGERFRSYL